MKMIRIHPNPSGAYPGIQNMKAAALPEGMALWPDGLDDAGFYEHNGFVRLTIEKADGVDTVTAMEPNVEAWEAWKAGLAQPEAPEPTTQERVAALEEENKLLGQQVEALAGQLDFQEECLVELAGVIYA